MSIEEELNPYPGQKDYKNAVKDCILSISSIQRAKHKPLQQAPVSSDPPAPV